MLGGSLNSRVFSAYRQHRNIFKTDTDNSVLILTLRTVVVEKETIKPELHTLLPDVYPDDLQECLQIFETLSYKSYGFPIVWIDYNYTSKCWSMTFRNPVNFSNPNIRSKTPIDAVHQMFDFLKEQKWKAKNLSIPAITKSCDTCKFLSTCGLCAEVPENGKTCVFYSEHVV